MNSYNEVHAMILKLKNHH